MSVGVRYLIAGFSFATIIGSLLIGIWAKKKVTTAESFFGSTALFSRFCNGISYIGQKNQGYG